MTAPKTGTIRVNRELCVGCGLCVESCPQGAITLRQRTAVIDGARCRGCGICLQVCPRGAISEHAPVNTAELQTTVADLKQRTADILKRLERLS